MESLGIDIKLLIAQIVNFFLFFLIFKKFIAKPFGRFLTDEKKKAAEKEAILTELKKKEEAVLREKDNQIKKVKEEQEKLMKQLKKEVKQMREKVITEAKKEAQIIINKGRRQAEEYQKKVSQQIDERIKELSSKVVFEVLSSVLTPQLQKEINQQMLKSLRKITSDFKKNFN